MGVLLLAIGVALLYVIPDYVVKAVNDTGIFCKANTTAAQCLSTQQTCCGDFSGVATANTQLGTVRTAGFAVVIISVIWLIVSVVVGGGSGVGKR